MLDPEFVEAQSHIAVAMEHLVYAREILMVEDVDEELGEEFFKLEEAIAALAFSVTSKLLAEMYPVPTTEEMGEGYQQFGIEDWEDEDE